MSIPVPLPPQRPESSPRSIRAALLPEDVADFDRQYREAMAEAARSLDLEPVLEMLEAWRRIGLLSRDPESYRRMKRTMARLEAGEDIPMTPWSEVKTRLELD